MEAMKYGERSLFKRFIQGLPKKDDNYYLIGVRSSRNIQRNEVLLKWLLIILRVYYVKNCLVINNYLRNRLKKGFINMTILKQLKEDLYYFIVVIERFGNIEYISRSKFKESEANNTLKAFLDMRKYESRNYKLSVQQVTPLFIERLKKEVL